MELNPGSTWVISLVMRKAISESRKAAVLPPSSIVMFRPQWRIAFDVLQNLVEFCNAFPEAVMLLRIH